MLLSDWVGIMMPTFVGHGGAGKRAPKERGGQNTPLGLGQDRNAGRKLGTGRRMEAGR